MAKLQIYIVEDDVLMAALLTRILTGLGHTVCGTADSYKKAVHELPNTGANLVISDIMLKGKKTGIDLGRYINTKLHIPFIYHSSVSATGIVLAAMGNAPVAYLTKPVTKTALAAAILAANEYTRLNDPKINLSTFCPL